MPRKHITQLQENFAQEKIKGANDTDAYKAAGYSYKNMKPGTINRRAHTVANSSKVRARIKELQAPALEKALITQDRILTEVSRIAFADLRKIIDENERILPISKWPDEIAAAIASVEIVTRSTGPEPEDIEYVHKVKLWDKTKNLELAGRHLKMWKDNDNGGFAGQINIHLDAKDAKA